MAFAVADSNMGSQFQIVGKAFILADHPRGELCFARLDTPSLRHTAGQMKIFGV